MATKHQTVLRVEMYNGQKVFTLGKMRLDRLPLTLWRKRSSRRNWKLRLVRDETTIDTATINEYGTHGAAPYYFGFSSIVPATAKVVPEYELAIFEPLLAKWLKLGDTIVAPLDHRTFIAEVMDYWIALEEPTKKYATHRRLAKRREARLNRRFEALPAKKQTSKLAYRYMRIPYQSLYTRIRRAGFPDVIKLRRWF